MVVDKGFWVWAVVYSNYDPAEVGSLHATEELAEAECKEKNRPDDIDKFGGNWQVNKMWVHHET